jgi:lysophospholipase L1-like esterase
MRSALFWGLAPLLLPQALYVRRTATRLNPAAGPNSGVVGDGDPLQMMAIGDSIIAGVGARQLRDALVGQTAVALAAVVGRRVRWSAHGLNGANTATVVRELMPRAPSSPADVVLVSVGVNDVTKMNSTSGWRRDLAHLAERIRRHSPHSLIVLLGLPPMGHFPALPQPLRGLIGMRATHFDEIMRELAATDDRLMHVPLHFVPEPEQFCADGYHPSELGYRQLGEDIAARLRDELTAGP